MEIFSFVAFIAAEVIPNMGDFGSTLGASFDSQFGLLFWVIAYWHLFGGRLFSTVLRIVISILHILAFSGGLLLLDRVSTQSLKLSLKTMLVEHVLHFPVPIFHCKYK